VGRGPVSPVDVTSIHHCKMTNVNLSSSLDLTQVVGTALGDRFSILVNEWPA
jgi:hypothetical protein